jgi:hypothetical protein
MSKEKNKVNEPQVGYHSGAADAPEISFFSSIQQQEEEHYK